MSYIHWYFFDERYIHICSITESGFYSFSGKQKANLALLVPPLKKWRDKAPPKITPRKKSETLTHFTCNSVVTSFVKSVTSSWVGEVNGGMWLKLVHGFSENFRHTFLSLYFVDGLASTHIFCSLQWKPYSFLSIKKKKVRKIRK